jgi:hypothetical protein
MSDLGHANWNEADASNNAAPPNGLPIGANPSDVGKSTRANMGGIKRFWDRHNAVKTTDVAGTSTAYTLTYAQAATAYYSGEEFSFVVDKTCGAAPTLNINALGAYAFRKFVGGAFINLAAGDIVATQPVRVRFSGATFDMLGNANFNVVLSNLTNSLASSLIVGGSYVDGPSVAQGSVGSWLATGTVTVGGNSAGNYNAKLYDGTTVIASTSIYVSAAGVFGSLSLSGIAINPAGNLRIAVNTDAVSANIISSTGNLNASTISAVRVG